MDLLDIHSRLFFLANKEENFWTREEIDGKLHLAQMWKFNDAVPLYAKNQAAQEALAPFKVELPITSANSPAGLITFSETEYLHFLGLYTQFYNNDIGAIDYNQVDIVGEDEIAYRLKSQLVPVTAESPIAMVKGLGVYQLYPKVPNAGYAMYFMKPEAPVFVFTEEGRKLNYNKSNSTQLLWSETCINEIIIKALQLLGVNINHGSLVQFTEAKDQQKI